MMPKTCKHFNGDHHNKACAAGVVYDDVTPEPKNTMGLALRRPCRAECIGGPRASASQLAEFAKRGTCPKFELPTKEDLESDEREMQAAVNRMMKLTPMIRLVKNEQRGKNWQGIRECPICSGRLHMQHSAYNGHMRGKCETEGCVNWIE